METGPKSRAKILINRPDSRTGERKDYPPSDASSQTSQVPESSQVTGTPRAFTLRKFLYNGADEDDGEIDITSQDLWGLLKALLGHYPCHIFQGSCGTLDSPYESLVLNWDKLEHAANETPKNDNDQQIRSDLKLLLDIISSSSGDQKLDKYFKIRNSSKEQKSVTFETLWTIFHPGSLVYGQPFQGQDQVFIVRDDETWPYLGPGRPQQQASWNLRCWTYDWDGKSFRRMCLKLEFEYFDGHKPITSLPYYPFELNEQRTAIKENLIERGSKYRQLCTATQGSRMFEYNGKAIFAKKGFSGVQGDDDKVGLLATIRKVAQDIKSSTTTECHDQLRIRSWIPSKI